MGAQTWALIYNPAAGSFRRERLAAAVAAEGLTMDPGLAGRIGPAGAGAVVKLPDGTVLERYRALGQATNNIGELTAIGLALDQIYSSLPLSRAMGEIAWSASKSAATITFPNRSARES